MMAAGLQPEQLAIEHVRHGGERVPILRMDVGERPDDTMPTQTGDHVRVAYDVTWIVEVDELMMKRLPKHSPRERNQDSADGEL